MMWWLRVWQLNSVEKQHVETPFLPVTDSDHTVRHTAHSGFMESWLNGPHVSVLLRMQICILDGSPGRLAVTDSSQKTALVYFYLSANTGPTFIQFSSVAFSASAPTAASYTLPNGLFDVLGVFDKSGNQHFITTLPEYGIICRNSPT